MAEPDLITIRKGVQFERNAGESFKRVEKALGKKVSVTFAYRSRALQLRMYLDWNAWMRYVNSGYNPRYKVTKPSHGRAIHPDLSWHCKGLAIDTDDWQKPGFVALMAKHGWARPIEEEEPWHFQYYPHKDNYYGQPADSGSTPFDPKEDELSAEAERQIDAIYKGLYGPNNGAQASTHPLTWKSIGGQPQSTSYGNLQIDIHTQTLVAQLIGQVNALTTLVQQLSVPDQPIDLGAITEAARDGAEKALSDLTISITTNKE